MSTITEVRQPTSTIPKTMRAAAFDRFGPPDVLTIHNVPVPQLDADEVLIAINTAGVGVWDVAMREGWMPSGGPPRFPLVLGSDGSGTIADVGSRVRRFKPDEQVYAYSFDNPKGGFYAEYVAVAANNVAPVPKSLDLKAAGAIPTTGLTALQGIDDALHLKKGETIVIHGASGGVGTMAVQFAKLRGARIFATASGADGVALVQRLGADAAVDGRTDGIPAAVRSFAPGGVDAVLALAGGDSLERCLDTLRPGGRVAYPHGVEPEPGKRPGIDITAYNAVAGPSEFGRLDSAIEEAKAEVVIAAEYDFAHAAKAHERIADGHVLGKIVLRVR